MDTEAWRRLPMAEAPSPHIHVVWCSATIEEVLNEADSFTSFEQAECLRRPSPELSLASRLAAKRGARRIAHEILGNTCDWPSLRDVHLSSAESGMPLLGFQRTLERALCIHGFLAAHVSLSHVRGHGAAIVVFEGCWPSAVSGRGASPPHLLEQ